jgi:GT2 family glycosyltransferase
MPKISVIIVNYATKGLIKKCVDNLLKVWDDIEVFFIDNDSPDGSSEEAHKHFDNNSKVTIIDMPNKGQPPAYNAALAKLSGDYVMYLGTDAFPKKEALVAMTEFLAANEIVGVVTPHLYLRDGSMDIDCHRGFPTPWNAITHFSGLAKIFPKSPMFSGLHKSYMDFDSRHPIDMGITHCVMVKRSVSDEIGKWDEDYFIFGEDIDFYYKVQKAGYLTYFLGDVRVLHYKGASVGRDTAKDIDNVLNTDFGSVSFGGKTIKSNKAPNKNANRKRPSRAALWMKIKITQEKTRAMRLFYAKHYNKKYPKLLNSLVLLGITVAEFFKVAKVILKSFF